MGQLLESGKVIAEQVTLVGDVLRIHSAATVGLNKEYQFAEFGQVAPILVTKSLDHEVDIDEGTVTSRAFECARVSATKGPRVSFARQ